MRVVGLTGGIASGKSTVVAYLQELGYPVVDCDAIAREVVEPHTRAYRLIVARYGARVCQVPGGPLNREELAKIVFEDRAERKWINSITHWRIAVVILRRLAWHWLRGTKIVILDAPLLFESGLQRVVSFVVCVSVQLQTQLERLMHRDRIDAAFARKKIGAQMSTADKCRQSNFVIDNNGTRAETQRLTAQVMQKIRAAGPSYLSRTAAGLLLAVSLVLIIWLRS